MDQAPEITIIDALERRFEMVEQIAVIQGRHKAELEPLNEAVRLCEMFIKDDMNKNGAQQTKSQRTGDSCNFTTKTSVTVKNMDAVIGYVVAASPPPEELGAEVTEKWPLILEHFRGSAMWTLFNQAVNKTQVADIIKQTNASPPGVEYSSYKDLSWKRGKGAAGATTAPAA